MGNMAQWKGGDIFIRYLEIKNSAPELIGTPSSEVEKTVDV